MKMNAATIKEIKQQMRDLQAQCNYAVIYPEVNSPEYIEARKQLNELQTKYPNIEWNPSKSHKVK